MEPGNRMRRVVWGVVIFLALIGTAVAVRRIVNVVPIALHGFRPPPPASNPVAAEFGALDDLFAHYPVLTLIHIVPGLLFMLLGPLQFSSTIRARHLRWHRWSGRNAAANWGKRASCNMVGSPTSRRNCARSKRRSL